MTHVLIEIENGCDTLADVPFVEFRSGPFSLTTCALDGYVWNADLGLSDMSPRALLQLGRFLAHPVLVQTLERDARAQRISAARFLRLGKHAHMRRRRPQLGRFCSIVLHFAA